MKKGLSLKTLLNLELFKLYRINFDIDRPSIENIDVSNPFLMDALFVCKKVEKIHPIFITHLYNPEEYFVTKNIFLKNSRNSKNKDQFIVHLGQFLKFFQDSHMNIVFKNDLQLREQIIYKNESLYFKEEHIISISNIHSEECISNILDFIFYSNEIEKSVFLSYYINSYTFYKTMGLLEDNGIKIKTEKKEYDVCFKSLSSEIIENSLRLYNNILIISVNNMEESINDNFIKELVDILKNNIVKNVIIDLRKCIGGSALVSERISNALGFTLYGGRTLVRVNDEIYPELKSSVDRNYVTFFVAQNILKDTSCRYNLVTLTSRYTYSSAFQYASEMKARGLSFIIGEVPCAKGDSFGDLLSYTTPYNDILFNVSHKFFWGIEETEQLIPDIIICAEDALSTAIHYMEKC